MPGPIEFFFDFASPYGFIAAMEIDALARRVDRSVLWRPFLISAVYKKYGQSPLEHPAKRTYVNDIDAPRTAKARGLTLKQPEGWPQHSLPPSRIYYWMEATDPRAAAAFAKAAYQACWLQGKSTTDVEAAAGVAASLGFERSTVIAGMQAQETKDRLMRESDAAVERGVFGSPFFIVEGEHFWGSDRLDQLEARLRTGAAASP